ncbi:uncharacterized protein LOC108942476 [Scleropages formosus]|uniref:Uncharacterized LOC108942476 n=1 Tax=Scleropages formosus TaxID=113540 RepID=A0A8C9RKQ7_SCLFO|nr:uncharacterized protein LOC108942476 [Scleropages formosus]
MGIESQEATPTSHSLSPAQVQMFQRAEPKTLGAIQIIIAVLTLCLSVTLLQQQIHFSADIKVLCVVFGQLILSGAAFVHAGRSPSVFWVKATLVLHLVSAAFTTAAIGLLSKHLPYRQDAYHCEHCLRLEHYSVMLIDGILGTLILFLVLELLICITALLYGLSALANGSFPLVVGSLVVSRPQSQSTVVRPEPPAQQPQVIISSPERELMPELATPVDEPQVAPADMEAQP